MPSDVGSQSHIQSEDLGEASRLVLIDRARQAWETGWSLVVEAVTSHVAEWAADNDDFATLAAEIAALKSDSARSSLVSDMRSEITNACEEFLNCYRQIERYCDDDFVRAWSEPWDYGLGTVTPTASDLLRDPTRFDVMLKASLKELTAESFWENVLFSMQYHAAEWRGRFDILKRVAENIATYHADFDKELFSLAEKLRGELPYEDCQAEVRVFIEKFAGGRDHPRWANAPPVELQFQCVDGSRGDEFTTFTLFNPFDRYDGPTELSQFWLQVVWKLSHLAYRGGTLRQQAKMRKQLLIAADDYLDASGYEVPDPKAAKPTENEDAETPGTPTSKSGQQADSSDVPSSGASKANTIGNADPVKRPSEKAFQAWRLRDLTGWKQKQIAKKLDTNQGQVSKWYKAVKEYLDAANIFPDLGVTGKPQSIDPTVIDMGARSDGLTPRQRERRTDDSDD